MYLLELESSILKQHGAGASQPQRTDAQGGPGAEFDRLVGQLRASWAEREDALVEALRVVKRDLSKHKQLNYSQQSLIDQLKAELQLLRAVKAQDDEAARRRVTVCRGDHLPLASATLTPPPAPCHRLPWTKLHKPDERQTAWRPLETAWL